MSIRFRLTLLYSGILAITLIAFSSILYFAQAQATLSDVKTNLQRQVAPFVNASRRLSERPDQPPPPSAEGNFPLPGRWTQIRDSAGNVIARTNDLSDVTLPLSDSGLAAVKNGSEWFEPAQVEDQSLLILSTPALSQAQTTQIIQVATPTFERDQSLATLRWILTIGSAIVTLAAFAIGWVLAGTALRPIHRITHTAQAIGAEHDFSQRVAHRGPNDEIGQLATTFNAMLTELESAFRQVERSLVAQRRFVADASHELRTPLTTIRGNIGLLQREPPLEDVERADVVSDAKDEVDRLIRLVQQLLVLARADSGDPIKCETMPLQPLLEDVCRQAILLAPQRTILQPSCAHVAVLANRDALKQVLLILLDNALVHTPTRAAISLTTKLTDSSVAITIQDSGPGIPAASIPHLFERFYRSDTSRGSGGAGLGLSIAHELVQAQRGTLTVASQVGQGSAFALTLPRATLTPL